MPTVKEKVQNDIQRAHKWKCANPGIDYEGNTYDYGEPKIYKIKRMIHSKAYQSLSLSAHRTYEAFLDLRRMKQVKRGKSKVWRPMNDHHLIFPYTLADEKYGISGKSFVRAIDELQAKGFIDITHQGNGGRKTKDGKGDYASPTITFWLQFFSTFFNIAETLASRGFQADLH